jgi:hypothetical protein
MVSLNGPPSPRTPNMADRSAQVVPDMQYLSTLPTLTITSLLVDLQLINLRSQLRQDLIGLLVIFELSGDQISQIPKWLRRIQNLYLD